MSAGLKKAGGCLLAVIGAMMIVCGIFFAVACYTADVDAGKKNHAQWEEYNNHLTTIDSLMEVGVPDSIIDAQYPRPILRQGGFATLFGGLIALVIIVVALIPLAIGLLLYRSGKKNSLIKQNRQ